MLSNVLQVLFNMSDIAVVGRFSGPIALGAVGSTATLVTLFTGFLIGLGSGINALVARFLGAGSREETQRTVHTALALSLIFGAVLLLLGELTAVPLLKLLGTKEELIDGATIYLRIYFLGMPLWWTGGVIVYLAMFAIGMIHLKKSRTYSMLPREPKEEVNDK